MANLDQAAIEQHNLEIHENAECWKRKPLLRAVYAGFYGEISKRINRDCCGHIVELGSGMGNVKQFIPECITTDLFPNPWLDQVEDAYRLSFQDGTVSNLILFDVWHHLEYPGAALREFRRVLSPGGRLIIFDPAMGLLGKLVFGLFHHEPLGLGAPIAWDEPSDFSPDICGYYAAQGNASRVFWWGEDAERLGDWEMLETIVFSSISYVASGGFRGRQLYPHSLLPIMRGMDRILSYAPHLFATRLLATLSRK